MRTQKPNLFGPSPSTVAPHPPRRHLRAPPGLRCSPCLPRRLMPLLHPAHPPLPLWPPRASAPTPRAAGRPFPAASGRLALPRVPARRSLPPAPEARRGSGRCGRPLAVLRGDTCSRPLPPTTQCSGKCSRPLRWRARSVAPGGSTQRRARQQRRSHRRA
ncbi:hypothetical protein BS78_08G100900 [Paspalum vaginatum]|nr:hypothetical protein BS78_08G100900 [Paspalum vaginatum]